MQILTNSNHKHTWYSRSRLNYVTMGALLQSFIISLSPSPSLAGSLRLHGRDKDEYFFARSFRTQMNFMPSALHWIHVREPSLTAPECFAFAFALPFLAFTPSKWGDMIMEIDMYAAHSVHTKWDTSQWVWRPAFGFSQLCYCMG